jgi:hypothetical protein
LTTAGIISLTRGAKLVTVTLLAFHGSAEESPPIEVQPTALSTTPRAIAKAAAVLKRCLRSALMMVASHMMLSTDLRYDSANHRIVG